MSQVSRCKGGLFEVAVDRRIEGVKTGADLRRYGARIGELAQAGAPPASRWTCLAFVDTKN